MREQVAIVTGGSRGLGRALAAELVSRGWRVLIDGRDGLALEAGARTSGAEAITGDITEPAHRRALVQGAIDRFGRLDLLVNNAGTLGASPLPPLGSYPLDDLRATFEANVVAALGLTQEALPHLRRSQGCVLNITSDAAVEAYPGWGGYGSSKAALDQVSRVLDAEEPEVTVWSVDPGDMRTRMHQDAFPGEDISDRPEPEAVAPPLADLVERRPPGGRIRLPALATEVAS